MNDIQIIDFRTESEDTESVSEHAGRGRRQFLSFGIGTGVALLVLFGVTLIAAGLFIVDHPTAMLGFLASIHQRLPGWLVNRLPMVSSNGASPDDNETTQTRSESDLEDTSGSEASPDSPRQRPSLSVGPVDGQRDVGALVEMLMRTGEPQPLPDTTGIIAPIRRPDAATLEGIPQELDIRRRDTGPVLVGIAENEKTVQRLSSTYNLMLIVSPEHDEHLDEFLDYLPALIETQGVSGVGAARTYTEPAPEPPGVSETSQQTVKALRLRKGNPRHWLARAEPDFVAAKAPSEWTDRVESILSNHGQVLKVIEWDQPEIHYAGFIFDREIELPGHADATPQQDEEQSAQQTPDAASHTADTDEEAIAGSASDSTQGNGSTVPRAGDSRDRTMPATEDSENATQSTVPTGNDREGTDEEGRHAPASDEDDEAGQDDRPTSPTRGDGGGAARGPATDESHEDSKSGQPTSAAGVDRGDTDADGDSPQQSDDTERDQSAANTESSDDDGDDGTADVVGADGSSTPATSDATEDGDGDENIKDESSLSTPPTRGDAGNKGDAHAPESGNEGREGNKDDEISETREDDVGEPHTSTTSDKHDDGAGKTPRRGEPGAKDEHDDGRHSPVTGSDDGDSGNSDRPGSATGDDEGTPQTAGKAGNSGKPSGDDTADPVQPATGGDSDVPSRPTTDTNTGDETGPTANSGSPARQPDDHGNDAAQSATDPRRTSRTAPSAGSEDERSTQPSATRSGTSPSAGDDGTNSTTQPAADGGSGATSGPATDDGSESTRATTTAGGGSRPTTGNPDGSSSQPTTDNDRGPRPPTTSSTDDAGPSTPDNKTPAGQTTIDPDAAGIVPSGEAPASSDPGVVDVTEHVLNEMTFHATATPNREVYASLYANEEGLIRHHHLIEDQKLIKARRSSISLTRDLFKRLKRLAHLHKDIGHRLCGDMHSHPQSGSAKMSVGDKNAIRNIWKNQRNTSFILAIDEEGSGPETWELDDDGKVAKRVSNGYLIKIRAYSGTTQSKKIRLHKHMGQ